MTDLKSHGPKEIKSLYLLPEGRDEAALGFPAHKSQQRNQATREQVYEGVALMMASKLMRATGRNANAQHHHQRAVCIWERKCLTSDMLVKWKRCFPQLVSSQGAKIPRIT